MRYATKGKPDIFINGINAKLAAAARPNAIGSLIGKPWCVNKADITPLSQCAA